MPGTALVATVGGIGGALRRGPDESMADSIGHGVLKGGLIGGAAGGALGAGYVGGLSLMNRLPTNQQNIAIAMRQNPEVIEQIRNHLRQTFSPAGVENELQGLFGPAYKPI